MYLLHTSQPVLFTGDTLFCGGCGSPMEGSLEDMYASFARIWRKLSPSPNALIMPGHEYTEELLSSCMVDPATCALEKASAYARLASALLKARRRRAAPGLPLPTIPTNLADELAFNVYFLRLHEAASTLAEAYRHRCAQEEQRTQRVFRPPAPEDGEEYIPTVHPFNLLPTDEPSRSHPPLSAEAEEGPDNNPTLVLVSSHVVRTLTSARHRRARSRSHEAAHVQLVASRDDDGGGEDDDEERAAADALGDERVLRESTALAELRAQRAHAEHPSDDWAAKRSRRLRTYLLERRNLGYEHGEAAVLSALAQFGLSNGCIPIATLTRALTTLGLEDPLTPHEARALCLAARVVDMSLEPTARGASSPPPLGAVSARALVSVLATSIDEMIARATSVAPPTMLERALGLLAHVLPLGADRASQEAADQAEAQRELAPTNLPATSTRELAVLGRTPLPSAAAGVDGGRDLEPGALNGGVPGSAHHHV
jgi:hypothetical protein